jgi:tRNA threonylcarbamoyladenosine biosynthesis protein TsaB
MSYILTIRTDKPEAEVGVYDMDGKQLSYHKWLAHRQLSSTLLGVIRDELQKQDAAFDDIGAVLVFRGPGSFTGLRIGITVANTIAHSLARPIVGVADEHEWLERGLARLEKGENDQLVLPEYGAEAHITQQKK